MRRIRKALKPKVLIRNSCPYMMYKKLHIILIVFIFAINTTAYCALDTSYSKANLQTPLTLSNNKDNKDISPDAGIVTNLAKKFIIFLKLDEELRSNGYKNYNNYSSVADISYYQISPDFNKWLHKPNSTYPPKLVLKDDYNKISVIILGEGFAVKTPLEENQSIVLGSRGYISCAVCASFGKDSKGKTYLIQWHFVQPKNRIPYHNGQLLKELFKELLVGLHDIQVLVIIDKSSTELPAEEELKSYWNAQSVNIFSHSDRISAIISEEGIAWYPTTTKRELNRLDIEKLIKDENFHVVQWRGTSSNLLLGNRGILSNLLLGNRSILGNLFLGNRLDAVNRSIER